MEGKFISYLRVSTTKQGQSGLGIDAQRKAITDYLNGGKWKLLREFVEIESGKRDDNRPKLNEALQACKRTKATLLIAKLDRLSRNVAFISSLMDSDIEFVACDFPHANKLTVHILAAVAQHEREMISKRTKEALQAAKARGVKLGSPVGLSEGAIKNGVRKSVAVRKVKADEHAKRIYGIVKGHQDVGMSLRAIARKFTDDGELTPRGKDCKWTPSTVKNVLKRIEG
ncbi:MAG: recombinase family protein [Syntrophorhabdaceae bacterium]|nr:recombinase family protein [Syntrophorhabdaceae bacterium]